MRRIPTFVWVVALCGSVPSLALAQTASTEAAPRVETGTTSEAAAVPPVYLHGDKRPGQSERLPRAWSGAPALIPHAVKGLTPITAKRNACAGCHGRAGATSGPPPAPPSHFVDLREAPGVAGARIAGSRWNCTACHVPQTSAPPLVP